MNKKNISDFIIASLLTALMLGAVYYFTQEDSKMAFAGTESMAKEKIPPMDKKVPDSTGTATFALG